MFDKDLTGFQVVFDYPIIRIYLSGGGWRTFVVRGMKEGELPEGTRNIYIQNSYFN